MTELKDIFDPNNSKLTDQMLSDYLEGKLSVDEQRKVEQLLAEEGMESDAIDGLKNIDRKDLYHYTQKINTRLSFDLKKRNRKQPKYFSDNKWAMLAILLVVLLGIIAYYVLYLSV